MAHGLGGGHTFGEGEGGLMSYTGERALFDAGDICAHLTSVEVGSGGGTEGCLEQMDGAVTAGMCGNGARESPEECDDGGTAAGDGCGATCEVECGYTCTRPLDGPSVCAPSCGNGVVDQLLGEECDSSEACCVGCKLIAGAVCCGGECCESSGSFRSRSLDSQIAT